MESTDPLLKGGARLSCRHGTALGEFICGARRKCCQTMPLPRVGEFLGPWAVRLFVLPPVGLLLSSVAGALSAPSRLGSARLARLEDACLRSIRTCPMSGCTLKVSGAALGGSRRLRARNHRSMCQRPNCHAARAALDDLPRLGASMPSTCLALAAPQQYGGRPSTTPPAYIVRPHMLQNRGQSTFLKTGVRVHF
jgi:hypothetical protein